MYSTMGAEALGHPVGVSVGVYRLAQSLVASIAVSDLGGVGSIALHRTHDQVVLNLEVNKVKSGNTSFASFFQRVLSFCVISFEILSREALQDLMHSAG